MKVSELRKALQTMEAMRYGDADICTEGCYTAGPDILSLEWSADGVTLVTALDTQETEAERERRLRAGFAAGLLVRK